MSATADSKRWQHGKLASILPELCQDMGWELQLDLHSVFSRWQSLVDEETAAHTQPQRIVNGTLWVTVENSAWMQHLQYRRRQLVDIINRSLQKGHLREIRFVLPDRPDAAPPAAPARVCFIPPPAAAVAAFEQLTAGIDDEPCRQALVHFWYLAQACQRQEKA